MKMNLVQFYKLRNIGLGIYLLSGLISIVAVLIYGEDLYKIYNLNDVSSPNLEMLIIVGIVLAFVIGVLFYMIFTSTVKKGNVIFQYIFLIYSIIRVIIGAFALITLPFEYIVYALGQITTYIFVLYSVYIGINGLILAKDIKKNGLVDEGLEIINQ